MRSSRQLAIVAIFFLQLLPVFADDVITNFLSPIASYQYPEDYSGGALTNGGIQSPIVSFQYLQDFDSEALTSGGVISPIASYEYLEKFNSAALTNGGIMSPIASYQYYEWPGNGILNLQYSPTVSYYYQFANSSGSIVLHGHVTDASGVPIQNAAVEVYIGALVTTLINADANGYYQIPSLGNSGVYSLLAVASGYQGQMRGLTLNANTAVQDFQLKPLPPTPAMQQVNRQPTLSFTSGPQGATLEIFDGTQFVPVTADNTPPTDRMTIVLTHGWINPLPGANGINDWPTTLAANLRANGITSDIANIVAWDWRNAATGIAPPQINTPSQGVALGENLLAALGANYSHPVHFFGHSLGTMVNAAAINFLHGEKVPSTHAEASPTPWPTSGEPFIHVTLFDEADEATEGTTASQLIFDGNTVSQSSSPELLSVDNNSSLNWSPPLPIHYTWADNYVGLVGFYHANAVNVLLQHGVGLLGVVAAHSYPQQWYGQSVLNPTDANNPLGFQNSFEFDQKNNLPLTGIPPAELSDAYYQTSTLDQLALSPIPFGLGTIVIDTFGTVSGGTLDIASSAFGNTADKVVTGVDGTVQFAGDVNTAIQDETQQADQIISQGFNYVSGVTAQGGQAVVNIIDSSASLGLFLTSGAGLPSPLVKNNLVRPLGMPNDGSMSNTPAMAWVPVHFPVNATGMAFDFTISGDPMDDVLVCGVGMNNLFSLEAKYIPTNTISASTLIDVSQWAGTTNELFFGFMGGTSTNATLQIQNIRFYIVQLPSLQAQLSGGNLILSWPMSAQNFSLQTTTNLADPNSWMTLTNVNVPAIVNLQNTITNPIVGSQGFYRLIQSQ